MEFVLKIVKILLKIVSFFFIKLKIKFNILIEYLNMDNSTFGKYCKSCSDFIEHC